MHSNVKPVWNESKGKIVKLRILGRVLHRIYDSTIYFWWSHSLYFFVCFVLYFAALCVVLHSSSEYTYQNPGQIINIDVWDENRGRFSKDDYLGSARVKVGEFLLKGGTMELELFVEGKPTQTYVTFKCELIWNVNRNSYVEHKLLGSR